MSGAPRVGIGLVGREGRYLVRRRPPGSIMAGVWEFPGGKCEPGEPPSTATVRECREEAGLEVAVSGLRSVIHHAYPHGLIELSFFDCATVDSHAEPDPESGFQWIAAAELLGLQFPGANEPILEELVRDAQNARDVK